MLVDSYIIYVQNYANFKYFFTLSYINNIKNSFKNIINKKRKQYNLISRARNNMSNSSITISNKRNLSKDSICANQIGKLVKANTRNSKLNDLSENDDDDCKSTNTLRDDYSDSCSITDEDDDDLNLTINKDKHKPKKSNQSKQKYRKDWENIPEYKGWLKPHKTDQVKYDNITIFLF